MLACQRRRLFTTNAAGISVERAKEFLSQLTADSNSRSSATSASSATVELMLNSGDAPVASILLNNPAKRNALTPQMMIQLADCVDRLEQEIQQDCPVVAVLLSGAQETFCAGLDLSVAKSQLSTPEAGLMMSTLMQDTLNRLHSLPIVSIAAIDGKLLAIYIYIYYNMTAY